MPPGPAAAVGWFQAVAAFLVAVWAAATDITRRKIADGLCLGGLLAGWAGSYARGGWAAGPVCLKTSLLCACFCFGVFAAYFLAGAVAAGDAKLAAALGALAADLWFVAWMLAGAAVAGALMAVVLLWRRGGLWRGLGRGLRQSIRWRYDRPPPGGRPPRLLAPAEPPSGATEPEKPPVPQEVESLHVPYGAALAAGLGLAALEYWRRGQALPFFMN